MSSLSHSCVPLSSLCRLSRGFCSHFVLLGAIESGRWFEADGVQQLVEVVDDALVEPIELATLGVWQRRVSAKRMEQAGRQGGVDPFKELEEDEGDRIAVGLQVVSASVRQFVDEPF